MRGTEYQEWLTCGDIDEIAGVLYYVYYSLFVGLGVILIFVERLEEWVYVIDQTGDVGFTKTNS